MTNYSEIGEYNIKRYKEVVTSTNSLILLFIFTLFYVWYQSIEPNVNRLQRYEKLRSVVQESYPKILLYKHRRDSLKESYLSTYYPRKRREKDSLKTLKADTTVKYFEGRLQDMKGLADSLREKIQLKIDIPTLSAVELPLRLGLMVWMFLFLIFCSLLYLRRQIAYEYLNNGLYYFKEKVIANNYNLKCLDISAPFWIAPVKIEGSNYEKRVIRVITKWTIGQKIYFICVILALSILLIRVWWITSIVNNQDLFTKSLALTTLGNILLFAPFVVFAIWILNPVKLKIR